MTKTNKRWIGEIKEIVVGLVCPPKCVVCEKILPLGNYICDECQKKLPYVGDDYCMKCGKPVDGGVEYCRGCNVKKHYFTRNVSLWTYSSDLKKSLYRFKYSNKRCYAKFFAWQLYVKYRKVIKCWKPDVIIPVPLYKKRQQKRGYNQAELIARELSQLTGISYEKTLVKRVKDTVPQKQLNDTERKKNINNAFKICKNVLKFDKVLLVDDIFTTGSTVDEIARLLKMYGVSRVYVITLCVGRGY